MNKVMPTENDPLSGFKELHSAVIDTSSVIYMQKAGFLDLAAKNINLHVPRIIIAEAKYSDLPATEHELEEFKKHPADIQCVLLAERLKVPVISEDKKVLRQTSLRNLPYYNSLMILNFLLFKKIITLETLDNLLSRLSSIARYSSFVLSYGESVRKTILNNSGE